MDTEAAEKTDTQTLLKLPNDLYERVMTQARSDKRTVRPELLILIEEAVTARERRK